LLPASLQMQYQSASMPCLSRSRRSSASAHSAYSSGSASIHGGRSPLEPPWKNEGLTYKSNFSPRDSTAFFHGRSHSLARASNCAVLNASQLILCGSSLSLSHSQLRLPDELPHSPSNRRRLMPKSFTACSMDCSRTSAEPASQGVVLPQPRMV